MLLLFIIIIIIIILYVIIIYVIYVIIILLLRYIDNVTKIDKKLRRSANQGHCLISLTCTILFYFNDLIVYKNLF